EARSPEPKPMPAVQFYHLTATPLERALPKLLEKALAGGFKVLLLAGSDERLEQLNQHLWMFDPSSFLPHGALNEGKPQRHPILLYTAHEAVNGDNLLDVVDEALAPEGSGFERAIDLFDGRDAQATVAARQRWTHYISAGYELSCLRQTESGG